MTHPKKEQNINLPWTNLPWNLLWLVNDTVFAGVPTLNHQLICDDIRASILPCQSDRFTSLKASSNTRLAAVRGQNMVRQFWGAFPIPQSEFHKDLGQTKISRRHSYSSGTYTPSLKEKNFKQTPPPPFFQKKNLPSINWEFVCVRFTGEKKNTTKNITRATEVSPHIVLLLDHLLPSHGLQHVKRLRCPARLTSRP